MSVRCRAALLALAILPALGCGGYRDPLPLRPPPIPYADTLPIREPADRAPSEVQIILRESVLRELVRAPQIGGRWEAANRTAFDDVVNSAWFEHRNGRNRMSPEEIRRGPGGEPPDTSRALTVVSGKVGGVTPGFVVRDARGNRYVFKFDAPGFLRLGSAAGVITNRLFHAAGYHVPSDHVVVFDSARLELSPDARIRVGAANRPMTRTDLERTLAGAAVREDGRFRALASKYVPGVPKGPFRFNGVRGDDPNDYYPHQHRREIRGLFVLGAWLNHVDLRYGNSLDTYVEPGYLRHYLIDFASSLGSSAGRAFISPMVGQEFKFDVWRVVARYVTLGLYHAPWELERFQIIHPSIGWMATETFDPGRWRPGWPNDALRALTPADGYWGAKLVASFDDEQIRAAVDAGQLPPVAADTLADILRFRRDRTVRHWFGEVTPVEEPEVTREAALTVAFDDLGIAQGLWSGPETEYRWLFSHPAREIRWRGTSPGGSGVRQRVAVEDPEPPDGPARLLPPGRADGDGPGLATLRITAIRAGEEAGRAAIVYLRPVDGAYRVVGLEH